MTVAVANRKMAGRTHLTGENAAVANCVETGKAYGRIAWCFRRRAKRGRRAQGRHFVPLPMKVSPTWLGQYQAVGLHFDIVSKTAGPHDGHFVPGTIPLFGKTQSSPRLIAPFCKMTMFRFGQNPEQTE